MLEYIKSSNRHAESHEKGPDVVKKLKNMQVYPLRPGRFQRHRPMGGDCKIVMYARSAIFTTGFTAIAPWEGTASSRSDYNRRRTSQFPAHAPKAGAGQ